MGIIWGKFQTKILEDICKIIMGIHLYQSIFILCSLVSAEVEVPTEEETQASSSSQVQATDENKDENEDEEEYFVYVFIVFF